MKQAAISFVMAVLAFSCLPWDSKDPGGMLRLRLAHGGRERECLVHVPAMAQTGPRPLLLVLHGGGGTARGMVTLNGNRFNELADRDGFYVAYPAGLGKSWNDLREDTKGYAHLHNIDDTGFIAALIDRLGTEYPIDKNRVFAAGISNGGFMCYRLACELAGRIRAIAAVSATHSAGVEERCRPAQPVSVMIINGTDDPIVPYGGGDVTLFGSYRGRVISTDDTVADWVRFDACPKEPAVRDLPDRDPGDKTRIRAFSYGPCAGGSRVLLYRVEGGGHAWPGGYQYLPAMIIGRTSRDIIACDEIWSFFSSLR